MFLIFSILIISSIYHARKYTVWSLYIKVDHNTPLESIAVLARYIKNINKSADFGELIT